ncbi:SiaB family protein kinase [Bernardetia sp. ABR2-2B]|uniref:SiaB family protein kinase n=1 Tax=Bernardetia sp. ABR2-2B TaxID=3127472 RepID=UPI0030D0C500
MHDDFQITKYYNEFNKNGVTAIFQGALSQSVLSEIAENLKEKIADRETIKSKIFAIFIELAQNIYHHSADKKHFHTSDSHIGVGIVAIRELSGCYSLSAGNMVEKHQREALEERCDYINGLDKKHLTEYYRQERKNAKGKTSTGAHVGLIDMVRRSGNPLEINFETISEKLSFFSITVTVDKDWQPINTEKNTKL